MRYGGEVTIEDVLFSTERTHRDYILWLIKKLAPRKCKAPLLRIGPKGDGGYLMPDDFDGIHALFSPGVGDISGFEKQCASMGFKVFMADPSVEQPAEEDPSFHFTKKYIGCMDSVEMMTLDTWVTSSLPMVPERDLMLQMDIEGAEYESIIAMSKNLLQRFRMIAVEFHALDQLWSQPFFTLASRAFAKLLQSHTCVHIHPNNCCGAYELDGIVMPRVCEFTFLRNDRGVLPDFVESLPHELDENNTENPTLLLDPMWLGAD